MLSTRRIALFAALALGLLAVIAVGAREFRQRFPNQGFFSAARLHDSFKILLGTDVALSRFQPSSFLKVERKPISKASVPAIDVHFHIESLSSSISPARLVAAMDAAGIDKVVNLGGLPGMFEQGAVFYKEYPDRFILFVKPEPNALETPGGVAKQVQWIRKAAGMGARGMKVSKSLGLGQYDADGKLVPVDDPRLDPIWQEAGRLGMPVLIHTADPTAFFEPTDAHNERYEELLAHPQWSYHKPGLPTKDELLRQRERLVARHPNTNFIAAHMGMNDDDLAEAARMLDRYPNYFVDMAAVVHSLGRQPYAARRFFIKYQDRILFGTDGGYGLQPSGSGWTPERLYRSYEEFLETDNEYLEYPLADVTRQGRWRIYGLMLPQDVLEKIYRRNAERLIPSHETVMARLNGEPR